MLPEPGHGGIALVLRIASTEGHPSDGHMSSSVVLPLAREQVAGAAAVLTRAFQDEPLSLYLVPDAEERASSCSSVFTAWIRTPGVIADGTTTGGGALAGVALWEHTNMTEPDPNLAERDDLPPVGVRDWSPPAQERFRVYFGYMEALHARLIPEAHWTLSLLGVDPAHQGRGYGTALLTDRLARIRAAGLPCYLTTGSVRNVAFYQRQGFQVIEHGLVPRTGLRFWALRRD